MEKIGSQKESLLVEALHREMMEIALKQSDFYQATVEKWNIGAGYVNKGFNEMALSCYQECLAWFEQANCREETGQLYHTLQNLYARMDRQEDAIRYGEKALAFPHDTLASTYGYILLSLSVSYHKLNPPQDEKALAYLQKVLHIASLIGNAVLEADVYTIGMPASTTRSLSIRHKTS